MSRITYDMVRKTKLCSKGLRKSFLERGITMQEFKKNGIERSKAIELFGEGLVNYVTAEDSVDE